jgi:hypothetical protein
MKRMLESLAGIPVLGYAIRWLAAVARLPNTLRSQGESIRQVHDWVHEAGPALARMDELLARHDGVMAKVAGDLEEVARIARESHGQATWLTGRCRELAEALEKSDARAERLRAGLDRHLPTILQQLSAQETNARNLKDWFDILSRDMVAQRERTETMAQAAAAGRLGVDSLATRLANAESTIGSLSATRVSIEDLPRLVAQRTADLEQRVASVAPVVESAREGLLALQGTVHYLLNRVEFVRRETLFELRYGSIQNREASAETATRVVSVEKVERAKREGLRLNVGCGHIAMEGYVNVDRRELPGVDVVAEVDRLPFDPGTVAELFSAHLLEHFPREQLRRELLPYWRSLLAEGGTLRAVVPDAATMIRKYSAGELPWEDLREVTFGGQDYSGDFHFDMFTPESLGELLREAGFHDPRFPVVGRANGRCYEMEVVAAKSTGVQAA